MAYVTKHLGFGVTVNTTYEPPFLLARRMSTLDHLTKGRIGWNIVTGYLDSAARSMGLDKQPEHDARYDAAEEYLEVSTSSGKAAGTTTRCCATRRAGSMPIPPRCGLSASRANITGWRASISASPRRSARPCSFRPALRRGDRTLPANMPNACSSPVRRRKRPGRSSKRLRRKAEEFGRGRDALRILNLITVVVGRTEKEAQDKLEDYRRHASIEASLAHYSSSIGIDLSKYGLDEPIEQLTTNANQSALAAITKQAAKPVTVRQIIEQMVLGSRMKPVVGSPEQIADHLQMWIEEAGIDGFNLARTVAPESLRDFVDLVVPVLQERGVFKADYAEGPLRQKLFGGEMEG
jgi:alkanesulfonate monooxygenase SsuD/methylene tetrahydromethanopterin reductase-like flavin-dependent oxidoreductase (luciferase family)